MSKQKFFSERDLEKSKKYWKDIPFWKRDRKKQEMIQNLDFASKSKLLFEFGHKDLPKGGYLTEFDLPEKYQRLFAAYRILAYTLPYDIKIEDFEFSDQKGCIKAEVSSNRLEKVIVSK